MKDLKDNSLKELKKLSDDDLVEHMAGYELGSATRTKAEWELWKRKNRWTAYRAWLSIVIAVIALGFSLWSTFWKST